jgi:hypothetical protein
LGTARGFMNSVVDNVRGGGDLHNRGGSSEEQFIHRPSSLARPRIKLTNGYS